jgi:hypothetical protein
MEVEEAVVSGEGGADMAMLSSNFFVRVSTAALRAAVSSLELVILYSDRIYQIHIPNDKS